MCAVPVGSPAIPIRGEPSGESRHFRVGKALDRVLDFGDGAHVRKGADMACRFKSRFGAKGRWRGFRAILKRSGEGAADSTVVAGTAAGVSALQPRLRNVTLRSGRFFLRANSRVDFWPQLRAPLLGRRDAAGVALRPPGPKVPGRVSKRAGPCIHQASARRKPPAYSPFDPRFKNQILMGCPTLRRLTRLLCITMSYAWKKSSLFACPRAAAAA